VVRIAIMPVENVISRRIIVVKKIVEEFLDALNADAD